MSILALCKWLADTPVGIVMRDSTWGFTICEIGHLVAFSLFGGAVLLMDLRVLGLAFISQPRSRVARELLPLTTGGVAVMFVTGVLMVANGPLRYYYNPAFRLKIVLFSFTALLQFLLQFRLARSSDERKEQSPWVRFQAATCLFLWSCIGLAGRAIGYI